MSIVDYPITLDEIDQWLFDSFGILPGACSSTENLRYTTAKMVAEVLWPKQAEKDRALTWEDVDSILNFYEDMKEEIIKEHLDDKTICEIILKRFKEKK